MNWRQYFTVGARIVSERKKDPVDAGIFASRFLLMRRQCQFGLQRQLESLRLYPETPRAYQFRPNLLVCSKKYMPLERFTQQEYAGSGVTASAPNILR